MARRISMRLFLYILLIYISFNSVGYSQITASKLVGEWHIIDICYKVDYLPHETQSKDTIVKGIKSKYINASLTFLNSKELTYLDKYKRKETDKAAIPFIGLNDYNWDILNETKIVLIEKVTGTVPPRINLSYKEDKIYFDYIGLIFVLKKLNLSD